MEFWLSMNHAILINDKHAMKSDVTPKIAKNWLKWWKIQNQLKATNEVSYFDTSNRKWVHVNTISDGRDLAEIWWKIQLLKKHDHPDIWF